MAIKLKIIKNEKYTLQDLVYGEKHSKTWKMRDAHCRTPSWARKPKQFGKQDTNTVGPGNIEKLENEK